MSQTPDQPYFAIDSIDGRRVLRYATADLMRPSCVNCHNTHKDTPKADWKVGDVRGVLGVILPMDEVEANTRAGLRETLALMVTMIVGAVGVMAVVIGRLQDTSDKLKVRVDELEESGCKIREINQELVDARDDALASSRAKSQFLANMSHELRTPLNAILGFSEMLQEDAIADGREESAKDLERINEAGSNLLGIITTILDLSRIDTGQISLRSEYFDIRSLLDEVGDSAFSSLRESGNTLAIDCNQLIAPSYG